MTRRILIHGDEQIGRARLGDAKDMEIFGNEINPQDLKPEEYDLIVLSNLIQQAGRLQVGKVLEFYRDALKEGGQLIVTVPSLEWACTELARNDDASMYCYLALFGRDDEPHLSGFKLLWLRLIVENAGFLVHSAHSEELRITDGEDTHRVLQNVVIGMKRKIDAGEAIA